MFPAVDDGSGHQINLIAWKTPPPGGKPQKTAPADLANVKLYSIVKAKGSVNEFWGQRQVQLKRITVLKDTNDEVAALAETTQFKRDVLLKPWVVSEEVVAEEKRKLAMDGMDGAREWRKLKKQTNAEKKEPAMGGEGELNMLIDSLVERLDDEEEWRKRKSRDTTEALSPKRKKPQGSVEPVPIPDTSYRGHRRPPGLKPPPLQQPIIPPPPPELLPWEREESPPVAVSSFRGRRRTTPASTPNLLPPPIPTTDAPPDFPPSPPLPLESTYRGHRRAHQAEKLQLKPEPGTNELSVSAPTSPDHSSTYHSRSRILKLPTDTPAPPPPYSVPNYSQQLPAEPFSSSYRGHRRIPKLPSDTTTPQITESPFIPPISYRERWRIAKAQKAVAALSGNMLATPELSGAESITQFQAPRPPPLPPANPEDLFLSMSTFVPSPPPEKVSSRHTHRADGSLRYIRYLDDDVPLSGNPPQVAGSSGNSSTYRGRRRV